MTCNHDYVRENLENMAILVCLKCQNIRTGFYAYSPRIIDDLESANKRIEELEKENNRLVAELQEIARGGVCGCVSIARHIATEARAEGRREMKELVLDVIGKSYREVPCVSAIEVTNAVRSLPDLPEGTDGK